MCQRSCSELGEAFTKMYSYHILFRLAISAQGCVGLLHGSALGRPLTNWLTFSRNTAYSSQSSWLCTNCISVTGWTQNPQKTSCEKCPKNDTFFGSEMFSKCMHMTMEPHQKMLFWLRAVRAVSDSAEVKTQRCPGTILHPGKINYNISHIACIWTAVYIPSIQYCSFFYYWRQYNCSLGYIQYTVYSIRTVLPVPLPLAQFC